MFRNITSGKCKNSWKLPDATVASSKVDRYAYCKLCASHFGVIWCGLNGISHHVMIPLLFYFISPKMNRILIDHFYESVKFLYIAFVEKLKSKFEFKSPILTNPKFIDQGEYLYVSLNAFDEIHASIPIKFDKAATKLEFGELLLILMMKT